MHMVSSQNYDLSNGLTGICVYIVKRMTDLALLQGRNFPFDACGRAFTAVPLVTSSDRHADLLVCNFDLLFHTLTYKV